MTSSIHERAKTMWPSILMQLGFPASKPLLDHKNVPCPFCGGRDRFQFSDRDGVGLWHCRGGCGKPGGDGFDLIMAWRRCDFATAAQMVEGVLGKATQTKPDGAGDAKLDPFKPWRAALPSLVDTQVIPYLAGRGIVITPLEARSLRAHPSLWHWPTQQQYPAMVARVTLHDGTELTSHSTFLRADGSGKADVEKPRLFAKCDSIKAGAVWFGRARPDREFIVAEGIETLLSALRLYGAESGAAALSATGLRSLVLPPEAKRARVFADHDAEGFAAAVIARERWCREGRAVVISHASEKGADANDVWLRRQQRVRAP